MRFSKDNGDHVCRTGTHLIFGDVLRQVDVDDRKAVLHGL